MDKETLNKYDKIMADVLANVINEAAHTDNKIYLKRFDFNQPAHQAYFYGACIASDICKFPIYFNTPLIKYIKLKLMNWKRRKQFKWVRQNNVPIEAIPIQVIIDHIENFHKIRPNADETWKSIVDTYYNPKKGEE